MLYQKLGAAFREIRQEPENASLFAQELPIQRSKFWDFPAKDQAAQDVWCAIHSSGEDTHMSSADILCLRSHLELDSPPLQIAFEAALMDAESLGVPGCFWTLLLLGLRRMLEGPDRETYRMRMVPTAHWMRHRFGEEAGRAAERAAYEATLRREVVEYERVARGLKRKGFACSEEVSKEKERLRQKRRRVIMGIYTRFLMGKLREEGVEESEESEECDEDSEGEE